LFVALRSSDDRDVRQDFTPVIDDHA
jgi:hypothetical protein